STTVENAEAWRWRPGSGRWVGLLQQRSRSAGPLSGLHLDSSESRRIRSRRSLLERLLDNVRDQRRERGAKVRLFGTCRRRVSAAAERLRQLRQVVIAIG